MDRGLVLPNGVFTPLEEAIETVEEYMDLNGSAVELYDGTNSGPHDAITAVDLLSLGALNAYPGGQQMTVMDTLWRKRQSFEPAIRRITREPLESLTDGDITEELPRLVELAQAVQDLNKWGGTRVAKLLHRLRPNIMPIWDEWVKRWYGGDDQSWYEFIEGVLADVRNSQNLAGLRQIQGKLHTDLPILRIWDIILWQKGEAA